MKTIIINVPKDKESIINELLKKHRLKSREIESEDEDLIAEWIEKGIESEDVPIEKVYAYLRKHGVDC